MVSVSSYLLGMIGGLFQMQKCGFCFQPSSGYDCWASSNAEVWFSVSSCLLGTILEHLQMQKAWFLFPAIFFVWSLSLFKCGSMVLFPAIFWVWLLSFFKCRSMVFVSCHLLGMILELHRVKLWFLLPTTVLVWILSSKFGCTDFFFLQPPCGCDFAAPDLHVILLFRHPRQYGQRSKPK